MVERIDGYGKMDIKTAVTVIYFSDAPYAGGAERYLFLLASSLDRERFTPIVVTTRAPGMKRFKETVEQAGVTVHEIEIDLLRFLSGARRFQTLIKQLGCDILHMNLPGPFDSQYSLVAPLAKLTGVRGVVSTEHLPMVPSFPKGRFFKSIGTRFIDRVITVSENNRDHLAGNHHVPPEKIDVVHIGIPDIPVPARGDSRGRLGLNPDLFYLLIAGSLEKRKGHEILFRAALTLPERIHILVAGSGALDESYRQIADSLGIGDRVHFLGQRDDIPDLLAASDIMVLPSLLEATPYIVIEAMAAGIPVIASGIFGIPELVKDSETGILVEPGNEASLAASIMKLMDNESLRTGMGKAGLARFRSYFTLNESVSRTVDVYNKILHPSGEES